MMMSHKKNGKFLKQYFHLKEKFIEIHTENKIPFDLLLKGFVFVIVANLFLLNIYLLLYTSDC